MTHSCLNCEWLFLLFFHGILLMCMSSCLKSATIPTFANETDRLALVDFKSRITQDPLQIMSSWNDSIHFCNWLGVTCGPSSKRVMVLNLTAKVLSGSIPPSIGNLTFLTGISLQNNSFYSEIPQEVGHLQHLQHLDLSGNSFGELLQSTTGFSENNLIGSGSFGSVYKGVLPRNGAIVAVKVLNLQQRGALNSFINECNALRSIRHRNLLKIMSACSSIDHKGNAFKSLIFEFMCNGNLEQWLYPKNDVQHQRKRLSFIQRLNIAVDVASALEYLHHLCQTQIVHCDLKPSNILLDEDMVAHVSDFGLVNFLFEASNNPSKSQTLSVGLKGSIGYIPPEYGMGGQVSTLGDIYSYGILLLEMFIGKRPIDEMFNDGLSIHKLTAMALSEHIMDIVDPSMFFEEDEENANDDIEESQIIEENRHVNVNSSIKECLILVFQIGLLCSKTSPNERISANVVVNEMNAIRDKFLKLEKENRRAE